MVPQIFENEPKEPTNDPPIESANEVQALAVACTMRCVDDFTAAQGAAEGSVLTWPVWIERRNFAGSGIHLRKPGR